MAGKDSHSTSIVGRRIKELREDSGWSQEKIGVAIGIDESTLMATQTPPLMATSNSPTPSMR